MTDDVTPLTPEEEAEVRSHHEPTYYPATAVEPEWTQCSWVTGPDEWPCDEARLLATLDAERSARVPAPADGLDGCAVFGCTEELDLCATHAREGYVRDYGPSDTPADGLDVERLATALHHGTSHYGGRANPQTEAHRAIHVDEAKAVAREYAALGKAPR